jgi:hypothetical protein
MSQMSKICKGKCKQLLTLDKYPFRKDTCKHRGECRVCINERQRKLHQSDHRQAAKKRYRESEEGQTSKEKYNKSKKCKLTLKTYRQTDIYKDYQKKHRQTGVYKEKMKRRQKRRDKDPKYKKLQNLRKRLRNCIFNEKVRDSTYMKLVGCTRKELKDHIESQFRGSMTWENHGCGDDSWQIDHIYPCKEFDLSKDEDVKKCNHWSNLQPLWKKENEEKADDIPENFYWEEEKWVYKIEQ